jgi:DNA relaxase NicK
MPKGIYGYPESAAICLNGAHLGTIGYGAKHGRNMVNITGEGCKRISPADYSFLIDATKCLDEGIDDAPLNVKDRVKLIRIDLAYDFYKGEVTWEDADASFEEGAFDSETPFGIVQPVKTVIQGKKKGINLGRTLNVGLRSSAIMCRVYEKGLEIFGKMPLEYQEKQDAKEAVFGPPEYAPPGTVAKDWLRVEVEFKPKDDIVLSWDMIENRDSYFAGAYKFTAFLMRIKDNLGKRPERMKDQSIVTLDKTVQAMRNSYGNTIHTLRQLGLSALDIINLLDTGIPNTKLMKAGVKDAIRNDPEWLSRIVGQDKDIPLDTPF